MAKPSSRLKGPARRKLLTLAGAYTCIGAVLLFILVLPTTQPKLGNSPGPDRLIHDPCKTGTFLPSGHRHVEEATFRQHRVLNEAYQRAVWDGLAPGPRHVERFAATKNWSAHAPSNTSAKTSSKASVSCVGLVELEPRHTEDCAAPEAASLLYCNLNGMIMQRNVRSCIRWLPFVSAVIEQWNGPFALALYIPAPLGSKAAAECRANILEYVQQNSLQRGGSYAVSLMYANGEVPNLHCDLSGGTTGFEKPYVKQRAFAKRFHGRPWTVLWNADYPVNELRSLARSMVRDDAFLYLSEADFMVPHDMHRKLTSGQQLRTLRSMRKAWLNHGERQAMIVPAFERLPGIAASFPDAKVCAKNSATVTGNSTCFMYGQYDVPVTKASLRTMVNAGRASFFYKNRFNAGHACYYPDDWLYTDELYEITYVNPCEPYWIALAGSMPPFEPRFKGRMRDKVSIVTHMATWGFSFLVNPELFVVHLPHNSVRTLTSMSTDLSVHVNMMTAPYALAQVQLQDATLEPQFDGTFAQKVPGLGRVAVKKPAHPLSRKNDVQPNELAASDVQSAEEHDDVARIEASYAQQPRSLWVECEVHHTAVWSHVALIALALVAVTIIVLRT